MNDNKSAFASSEYDTKIRQTLPYYDEFYKQVIELVKALHNSAVMWLDIGCGTGKMASIAFQNIELEKFVFCDSSDKMIKIAKERFSDSNTEFSVCDVQNLSYVNQFDVITAIQAEFLSTKDTKRAGLLKECFTCI